jgi:hypothetical protein
MEGLYPIIFGILRKILQQLRKLSWQVLYQPPYHLEAHLGAPYPYQVAAGSLSVLGLHQQ